ncbi:hypothetical protein HPB50_013069 [Hyalomma asiaticum]|uniref:Uncharacterized protein n=1 Tax=Hyalomma asiaticum TaxID=266040 RepID=A0ACB7TNF0_HYAAI|nr:hypothetical protein HPB50_013069 [Hyalomma asiaticum]
MVAVSIYYRPFTSKDENVSFMWLSKVQAQAGSLLIVVGRDYNAKHPSWGYVRTDSRGFALHDTIEMSALNLCNTSETIPHRVTCETTGHDI